MQTYSSLEDVIQNKDKVLKDLIKEAKDLLNNLGDGDISPSAYDTAWVARIPDKEDPTKPMFPQCLQWVKDNQLADGSWGAPNVEYYHDRIICTLSCLIALKTWTDSIENIRKGEDYINKNLDNLQKDPRSTHGFELVFTSMVHTAQILKINLNYAAPTIQIYNALKLRKLEKIPLETLCSTKSSISYSLEFLENEKINPLDLKVHQGSDGSYGCSPGATAYILLHIDDPKAESYLRNVLKKFTNFVPIVYPLEIFEKSWVINNFLDSNISKELEEEILPSIDYLNDNWNNKGVGLSINFSTPDLDDTAMSFRALNAFNIKKEISVFRSFESEDGFLCYKGEVDASPSHLGNLMLAVSTSEEKELKDYFLIKANSYLLNILDEKYSDKWNISNYYTMNRILPTLKRSKDLSNKVQDIILKEQKDNGSWGKGFLGTVEETAYVLPILVKLYSNNTDPVKNVILKAIKFILSNDTNTITYLWLGKCLYSPINIRKSFILSSLIYTLLIVK
jgi:hypothetical protein